MPVTSGIRDGFESKSERRAGRGQLKRLSRPLSILGEHALPFSFRILDLQFFSEFFRIGHRPVGLEA
ncbi:MAG: hypothetical protein QOH70_4365 [Blastocatellia bacterium]|jgi:hypothetical protein|nr:hypothetical protein [Blastocatellia bacterium]